MSLQREWNLTGWLGPPMAVAEAVAGLWVRLNPDAAYVEWVSADLAGFPDNDANDEPSDWLTAIDWAHPTAGLARTAVPLAAVAEMADRVQTETWDANLSAVLVAEPRAELGTP